MDCGEPFLYIVRTLTFIKMGGHWWILNKVVT